MKNNILFLFKSKFNLNVKGNNIERFIKRLKSNNIEILNIKYISKNEVSIKIYKYDYDKVIKLKTIYEINIIESYGIIKIIDKSLENRFMILFILISLISLYIITNIIFDVDVITNDSKMGKTLLEEFGKLGLKKYNFKKNYNRLQEIKKTIINNHRDEIEWIEIENIGTKYIIRYEPRIKNKEEEETVLRNIVARKNCVIKGINVSKGQIIKNVGTYVKKGDVIVSGYIDLNGTIKDTVSSTGTIYGEVWYKVEITYPYKYSEVTLTGNKNKVLVIKILNKEIELFNFNKYKTKKSTSKTILKNNLLPIKLVFQDQMETIEINENNKESDIIEKSISLSKDKIQKALKDGEFISSYKVLNKIIHSDSLTLNIFFSVIEDVTDYEEIKKYEEIVE